jgi:hypothetical protein
MARSKSLNLHSLLLVSLNILYAYWP